MKRLGYLFIFLFLCFVPGRGQQGESLNKLLQQRSSFLADSFDIPGMSVSVMLKNKVIYQRSFGQSNLEYGIPMTDTSLYRIWSVSKQFAAVSILKLREEGKLKLDNKIGMYLDTIPEQWEEIRIRNLMNQTGGIKDYLNDYPEGRKLTATPYEMVRDSTANLKFPPGTGWSYTNTGYWVMTKIVESISGLPYQQYIEQNFFRPSGMELTRKMDYYSIIPGRVSGYLVFQGGPL